ncbi:MAG TPA: DUF167 domain-containing protein [Candidatus Acidoferrum sp.]|nr:DUF167 domain-containing protein [Candidatus Acidoferrum sp.]
MIPEIVESAGAGAVSLRVRVQPRASRDEIAGVVEGALKVRLQAPAVENRANEALVEFLAGLLKTPKSAVRILAGERSRIKRVEIRGVTKQEVLALLTREA